MLEKVNIIIRTKEIFSTLVLLIVFGKNIDDANVGDLDEGLDDSQNLGQIR